MFHLDKWFWIFFATVCVVTVLYLIAGWFVASAGEKKRLALTNTTKKKSKQ